MYYIKLITNQDETRTPLISNRALNNFFNLFLEKRNDDYIIPLFYINSCKSPNPKREYGELVPNCAKALNPQKTKSTTTNFFNLFIII